jgi:predicted enzyme related to lactoylglutathione lyase
MNNIFILCALVLAGQPARSEERPAYTQDLLIQLAVSDLDHALEFYCETLGFELEERADELQWARVGLGIAGVTLGLGQQTNVEGSGSLSLNLGVADIDRARQCLESKGVVFAGPTITIPGVVRLADFADPDGNRIRLAADIPPQH